MFLTTALVRQRACLIACCVCLACRRCIKRGRDAHVRELFADVERDCADLLSGLPLYEPLFVLMCAPVPNTVKVSRAGSACCIAVSPHGGVLSQLCAELCRYMHACMPAHFASYSMI